MYEGTSCFNNILLFWTSLNSYPPFHLNENTNHFRWLISEDRIQGRAKKGKGGGEGVS